ncbi:putative E3 ubiquitin-protein ligase RHG1A [Senna tora]|uniref:RING-type E3 ubiquitin transferase n=1 Tax=Senna tora TaxID=362788 RepID=A0A834T9A6_9FABA|nr:putative E3 ubiquitin-protein ligase RHG1A [Senna tora]
MQGQRGTIGSLPETIEFDCGSTSSNATVDQQICWDSTRNPDENQISEFILSPADMNPAYANSINHDWKNLSGWSFGGPSSSGAQTEMNNNEQKRELGWSSSRSSGTVAGSRLEQHFEPTNFLSLDNVNTSPMCMHSSNPHAMSHSLNLNAGLADGGSDTSQNLELSSFNKSSGSVNEPIPPSIGSAPFFLPSGNNNLVDEAIVRPNCSHDTRRVSRKRKAVDGYIGQSSGGGSSSYCQHPESSAWHTLPTQNNDRSSLSRSAPSAQVSSRLGLGMRDKSPESIHDLNVAGSSNSFHRNIRLRINPSNQQDSVPPTAFSNGNVIRHSTVSPLCSVSQRFPPLDNSLDLRSAPSLDNMVPQSLPLGTSPSLPRNMQPFRWNGSSSSRNSHLSNTIICSDRDNLQHEEPGSRSMPRNISEHPMLVTAADLRNVARNPTSRSLGGANLNVNSSSRTGSNSFSNHPPPAPTWVSRPNPPQYPRRLSEYVRRSLLSSGSEAAAGSSNNYSFLRAAPITSSEARALSSRAGSQGRHQSHSRSLSWLERQGDSDFRVPYSLQTLAVASEGSSRLVSELRNVLGIMRRGGNLRFEDFMILDHSIFSGMADIHDRHRDMRLDVDNMSYEELLALEERIGNVSTGLSEETILKLLKQKKYSVEEGSQVEAEPCCICQEEFSNGNDIGTLDCGHDYHTNCIKQWLMQKNLCPICKTTGLAT